MFLLGPTFKVSSFELVIICPETPEGSKYPILKVSVSELLTLRDLEPQ